MATISAPVTPAEFDLLPDSESPPPRSGHCFDRPVAADRNPACSPTRAPGSRAVEIVSPSESAVTLERKIAAYLLAGIQEVWVLYPGTEHLFIHTPRSVRLLDRDSLIETPLLPGWSLPLNELLRKQGNVYL